MATPTQRAFIENAISNSNNTLVYGEGGTGKTETLVGLYKVLELKGRRVQVACPTAAAAQNFKKHGIKASTLHSLFKLLDASSIMDDDVEFKPALEQKLDFDFLIVDEVSMVGMKMFNIINLYFTGKIIWSGDSFQLPPVRDSQVNYRDQVMHENQFELLQNFRTSNRHVKKMISDLRTALTSGEETSIDLGSYADGNSIQVVPSNEKAIEIFKATPGSAADKRFLSFKNDSAEAFISDLAKAYRINPNDASAGVYMANSALSVNAEIDGTFVNIPAVINGELLKLVPINTTKASKNRMQLSHEGISYRNLSMSNKALRYLGGKTGVFFELYEPRDIIDDKRLRANTEVNGEPVSFKVPYLIAVKRSLDLIKLQNEMISTRKAMIREINEVIPGYSAGIEKAYEKDKRVKTKKETVHVTDYIAEVNGMHGDLEIDFKFDGVKQTVKESHVALRQLKNVIREVMHVRYVSGMTIHKSQGQSLSLVMLDSASKRDVKLWYVAISRTINKLVFIGNPGILHIKSNAILSASEEEENEEITGGPYHIPPQSSMIARNSNQKINY